MSLHQANLRERALTDRDAAWELSDEEIADSLRACGIAPSRHARQGFEEAWRAMNGIPKLRRVPVPVALADEIVARPWAEAPTEEETHLALTNPTPGKNGGVWL